MHVRERRRPADRLGRRSCSGASCCARSASDLHTIFHCNSQQLNLLAGAGAATKAECGFSGLEVFGFANGLRRAVESGRLALEDYSNLAMPLRLLGGALNWPFVPATVNIGSDLQDRSAFAPEEYPSRSKIADRHRPLQRAADRRLPAAQAGPCGHPCDAGRSARQLHHARHRVEPVRAVARRQARGDPRRCHRRRRACIRQFPNLVRIPEIVVEAVVYWPFAAWPQSSPGMYDVDEEHMRLMNKALATPEGTAGYVRDFVESYDSVESYLDMIGRDRLEQLGRTATGFLLDPYRKWIMPAEAVARLQADGGAR